MPSDEWDVWAEAIVRELRSRDALLLVRPAARASVVSVIAAALAAELTTDAIATRIIDLPDVADLIIEDEELEALIEQTEHEDAPEAPAPPKAVAPPKPRASSSRRRGE